MSSTRIEVGDIVSVDFNGSQFTLCSKARVEHMPQATGDSWVFTNLHSGAVHHVSEGCTITRLADRRPDQEPPAPPPPPPARDVTGGRG